MLRRMYQGGSSAKEGPRIAIREQDIKLPRDANVRACEWPSDDFMVEAGFKEEFDAYVRNAELEDFLQDKCPQYYQLTDSFVRRFEYISSRNSPSVMFDIYDTSYTMDWRISQLLANSHSGVILMILPNLKLENFLLVLLWENLET